MDWNRSRTDYYADFFVVPVIIAVALLQGNPLFFTVVGGVALWTFFEYWIHRVLFHHVFKQGHDAHHKKPRGFVAAPWLLTFAVHLAVFPLIFWSPGLLAGLELGYYAYIFVHDKIHHHSLPLEGWLLRRERLHDLHHKGTEKNFGVTTSFWDEVFHTNMEPLQIERAR